jgi:hypothetical protein
MRTLCSPSLPTLLAAFLLAPLWGLPAQVPENLEVRDRYREVVLGSLRENAAAPAAVLSQADGSRVQFRTERSQDALYTLFLNQEGAAFPIDSSGSWVIKRSTEDGGFVQAKVFFRNDPGCFVRLFPSGARTQMEVFLFGVPVARRAQLPVPFSSLLTAPFDRVVELTRAVVRWDLLLWRGEPAADRHQEAVIQGVRSALGSLREADDGALDEEGRYVRIADGSRQGPDGGLNCSGFAKWIVDGFYGPQAGGRSLAVAELKQRHLGLRGNRWSQGYEQARDPYFGLDWARNLASALGRAYGEGGSGPESSDVRHLEYLEYREDVGYPVEELELALFLAAARDPGNFYLGSLNRELPGLPGQPVLRQHYHLAVFLPFFTTGGEFRVAVFDLTRESRLEDIRRRFAGHFVHLQRLSARGRWVAPRQRPQQ